MKLRCKIDVYLVKDLIDKDGNMVPATDIIESMLLEEFESIEVSKEQYEYMQEFCSDGELHSLDEMREDIVVMYEKLSAPRLAYIEKIYKNCNMTTRLLSRQQRIKASVVPFLSNKFLLMYNNDYMYAVENDIVYKHYHDGRKSVVLCLNKNIESFTSDANYIEDCAFSRCRYMKSVNLPNVKEIGVDAFIGCLSLNDVHLSNCLEVIGSGAFMGCHFLDYIELPSSLREIGDMAFCDCMNLTHIINDYDGNLVAEMRLHPNVLKIGENAFLDTPLEYLSDNTEEISSDEYSDLGLGWPMGVKLLDTDE